MSKKTKYFKVLLRIIVWVFLIFIIRYICYRQIAHDYVTKRDIENVIEIKVGKDKEYKRITDAVNSITDSSLGKRYNIVIDSGTYDLYQELGGDDWFLAIKAEDGEKQGVLLPPYVNLIGQGEVVIKLEASDDLASKENVPYVSVLNLQYSNVIKNISFYGKNVRYVIHDESIGKENIYRLFENCYFEHEGNVYGTWWARHTIGCGTCSNGEYYYKNCTIVNDVQCFFAHNQPFYILPSKIVFENTELINTTGDSSVALETIDGSLTGLNVEFNNCEVTGYIETRGSKCRIVGQKNNNTIGSVWNNTNNYDGVRFDDEVVRCINDSGKTLKHLDFVYVKDDKIIGIADCTEECSGVVMDDVSPDEYTSIKYAGVINITELNLDFSPGTNVTLVSGKLEEAGKGDKVLGTVYTLGDHMFLHMTN